MDPRVAAAAPYTDRAVRDTSACPVHPDACAAGATITAALRDADVSALFATLPPRVYRCPGPNTSDFGGP
jgi:hypothetical protein